MLLLERGATRQPERKSAKTGSQGRTWVRQKPRTEESTASGSSSSDGSRIPAVLAGRRQNGKEGKQPSSETWARSHMRACNEDNTGRKRRFFSAAYAGCRMCARRYIQGGMNPAVQSDSGRHNALDWAMLGHAEGQDTDWVIGFLEGKGVEPLFQVEADDDLDGAGDWYSVEMMEPRSGGC